MSLLSEDTKPELTLDVVKAKFTKEDGSIDTDALLNKALHADMHIPKIEGENANLRKEVDSRINYEDLLDKLNASRVQSASSIDPDLDDGERDEAGKLTEDAIDRMIESKLTKKQQEAIQASNVAFAKKELARALGPDYVQKLRKMAPDLDMTEGEMEYLAATKPKALLQMVAPQQRQVTDNSFTPPVSRTNTSSMVVGEKTNSYYKEQIRKNPKLASDAKFVREQMTQAKKLGEAFFD